MGTRSTGAVSHGTATIACHGGHETVATAPGPDVDAGAGCRPSAASNCISAESLDEDHVGEQAWS